MKRQLNLWFILIVIIIIGFTMTAASFANSTVKIMFNGQEINSNVSATIINGKSMVPIRSIADMFNLEVQWDEKERAVNIIDENNISKEFVVHLIREQGEDQAEYYYFDGLHYELINIDGDGDLEILAHIDGGVNLGQFFIFDKSASGKYELVTEENWKVERWNVDTGIEIQGEKVFELVTRTGGTGLRIITAHLWYFNEGEYVEIWQGTLEEMSAFADEYSLTMGSYQVASDDNSLYYWQSKKSHYIVENDLTPKDDLESMVQIYQFLDGTYTLSANN